MVASYDIHTCWQWPPCCPGVLRQVLFLSSHCSGPSSGCSILNRAAAMVRDMGVGRGRTCFLSQTPVLMNVHPFWSSSPHHPSKIRLLSSPLSCSLLSVPLPSWSSLLFLSLAGLCPAGVWMPPTALPATVCPFLPQSLLYLQPFLLLG